MIHNQNKENTSQIKFTSFDKENMYTKILLDISNIIILRKILEEAEIFSMGETIAEFQKLITLCL